MKTSVKASKIRVLIAEDHLIARVGVAAIINVQPDMKVVGEAVNGQQAVEQYQTHKPDVTLLDSLGALFVTRLQDIASTGLIHGSYGVGATLGPLVVAVMPSWRLALVAASSVAAAALVMALRARAHWPAGGPRPARPIAWRACRRRCRSPCSPRSWRSR